METGTVQPELLAGLLAADQRAFALLCPPADLTVSEWAELNRILPRGSSARPGAWRTESYQHEILSVITDPYVREIVFAKSSQIGWSEILNNVVGFYIDVDPKPILMIQPTDNTAKAYSKKRLAPMIASCEVLRRTVRKATSRRDGNTIMLKEFDGGFLKLAGANAAPGLRSDPIAILICDEIDAYPDDVNGEGDPIEIAQRRTDTFDDAKILKGGTPGKPRGLSRVESEWERSDQRRYFVPCPHCGVLQVLNWKDPKTGLHRLVWDKDAAGQPVAQSVRYLCAGCGKGIDEKYKQRMLDAGSWQAQYPGRRVVGFHINALYSPWRALWDELAQEWTDAQDDPTKLKAFVNLRLAETWDEGRAGLDPEELEGRRAAYAAEVPNGVGVLVASVDVQHNRLEAQIMGFGAGEESWLIAYEKIWGNPGVGVDPTTGVDVWASLDEFLLREWKHESGRLMTPVITLVDSGDHADSVYDFVRPLQFTRRRVFACKGVDFLAKPGLAQEGTSKRSNVRLWIVGTYAAKDRILARMEIPAPGPGYLHLPEWATADYVKQLTGEKKIMVMNKRTRTSRGVYKKVQVHNEALDLNVYCHAGLFVLQTFLAPGHYRDLGKLAADAATPPQVAEPAAAKPLYQQPKRNWVKGWRQ